MTITKEEQISQRQARVLELSAQGMTQYEIVAEFKKMGIEVSQKTVSNDIASLRKEAVDFVKQNREHIAFEYQQALSNFYQLRKEAWVHFHKTGSEGVKTNLYGVIESINNNIMSLLAAGDMIELELLHKAKEKAQETKEDIEEALELQDSQA